jgi:hypothetical protein
LHRASIIRDFTIAHAVDVHAQPQTACPHATRVLRATAIFQHFERTNAEAVAEICGLVDCSNHDALLMQRRFALREIFADVLRQRRLRAWPVARSRRAGSQSESRKQNSTQNVSPWFATI